MPVGNFLLSGRRGFKNLTQGFLGEGGVFFFFFSFSLSVLAAPCIDYWCSLCIVDDKYLNLGLDPSSKDLVLRETSLQTYASTIRPARQVDIAMKFFSHQQQQQQHDSALCVRVTVRITGHKKRCSTTLFPPSSAGPAKLGRSRFVLAM